MITNQPPSSTSLLSSIPARWIDSLIRYSPRVGLAQPLQLVAARCLSLVLSVTIFPALLSIDLARSSTRGLFERTWSRLTPKGPARTEVQETARKTHEVTMKCLRGLVSFPLGLVWRDVVTNHFLAEPQADGQIHPTGGLYAGKAVRRFPKTPTEVQDIICLAIEKGQKISMAGTGFCQGKQTLPPSERDIHINMRGLNKISIDPDSKIAVVGAGATWCEIQDASDKHGLAVQVMQASNVFSVGGSLSANCHGWDHSKGSLANTVHAITVVDAKGKWQRLTPEDELFHHVVGGYGMFAAIVEVELELTDNQELFDFCEQVDINDYPRYFREQVQANPNTKMHLYRMSLERGKLLDHGWAQNYSCMAPHVTTAKLETEPERGTVTDRVMIQVARNSSLARTLWWKKEEKSLGRIKKATRNEIMRPPINAVFASNSSARREWLQEYFVSAEELPTFLKFLASVLNENEVALMNASVRFVSKDERATLGYARKGDRFAVVLFFSQSLNEDEVEKTKSWVQKVNDYLGEHDGAFYLPYMHFATKEQFQKCYPQWQEVQDKKAEYDPEQLFNNGLFQDYLA